MLSRKTGNMLIDGSELMGNILDEVIRAEKNELSSGEEEALEKKVVAAMAGDTVHGAPAAYAAAKRNWSAVDGHIRAYVFSRQTGRPMTSVTANSDFSGTVTATANAQSLLDIFTELSYADAQPEDKVAMQKALSDISKASRSGDIDKTLDTMVKAIELAKKAKPLASALVHALPGMLRFFGQG